MLAAAAMHAKTTRTRSKAIHGVWRRFARRFGAAEMESPSEAGREEDMMGGSIIRVVSAGDDR